MAALIPQILVNYFEKEATNRVNAKAEGGEFLVTPPLTGVKTGASVKQIPIDLAKLLAMQTPDEISAIAHKLVLLFRFTTTEAIAAQSGDRIVLIGDGAINTPADAKEGAWFSVFDPLLKLRSQSNKVIALTDQTIAKGQLKTGVVATNEFNLSSLSSGYFGGEIVFVMGSDKNWLVSLAIANVIKAEPSTNDKTPVSENTAVIPKTIKLVGSRIERNGSTVLSVQVA